MLGLRELPSSLPVSFGAVMAALLLAPVAFPAVPRWVTGRTGRNDLPWRMAAAAALVLIVSATAAAVGPRLAGLFLCQHLVVPGVDPYLTAASSLARRWQRTAAVAGGLVLAVALVSVIAGAGVQAACPSVDTMRDAVQRFRTRIEEKENEFSAKIEVNISRFFDMKKGLESSQETLIENLQSEKRRIEQEIRQTNDQQLKLFDQELTERENRYRSQLTSLSSESVSDFRGKVGELMDRLMEMKSETTSTFNEFQENQQEVYAAIVEETRTTGQEIRDLKEALRELKAEGMSIEKSKQSAETMRTLIRELGQKIEQAEGKNQILGEVYQRVEEMKEMRTKLETELLMLKDKRDKVDRLEESINFVLGMQNEIEAKSVTLKKLQSNLDEFSAHYAKLDEERRKADVLMQNLIDEARLAELMCADVDGQGQSRRPCMVSPPRQLTAGRLQHPPPQRKYQPRLLRKLPLRSGSP